MQICSTLHIALAETSFDSSKHRDLAWAVHLYFWLLLPSDYEFFSSLFLECLWILESWLLFLLTASVAISTLRGGLYGCFRRRIVVTLFNCGAFSKHSTVVGPLLRTAEFYLLLFVTLIYFIWAWLEVPLQI